MCCPMTTRGDCYHGPNMLSEEGAAEPGYFVRYPYGYESWSPKDVFEAAYRSTSGMNFGLAIEAMKGNARTPARVERIRNLH